MKDNSELREALIQALKEQSRLHREYSKKFVNSKPLNGGKVRVHSKVEMRAAQKACEDAQRKAKKLSKEYFGF